MIDEKSFMCKDSEFIFCGSFSISGKIWPSLMYTTPFVPHVFSSFLFYQELRTVKNYRAFRFKLPDKKMISLHRITIFQVECRSLIKICSFSFFRIWSAIAQQITRDLCKYCTSFGVFIRLELDVQLHFHFLPVWGKCTKFSSVPTKIMAMDVPAYACIKFN